MSAGLPDSPIEEEADDSKHPAALAWQHLTGSDRVPSAVHCLKDKRRSAVYRLDGLLCNGVSVIAKRSTLDSFLLERAMYESVLPQLRIQSAKLLGSVQSSSGSEGWLFLEDVQGEPYDCRNGTHRDLAGSWLGAFHRRGMELLKSDSVPDRSLRYYQEILNASLWRTEQGQGNPMLDRGHVVELRRTHRTLESLERQWNDVESLCSALPRTLVHGDFAPKNMIVSQGTDGPLLIAIDWASAGWGLPIVDLAQNESQIDFWADPDLKMYRAEVGECWRIASDQCLAAEVAIGKILRSLSMMYGESRTLTTPWPEKAMRNVPVYSAHITAGMEKAGLTSTASSDLTHPRACHDV